MTRDSQKLSDSPSGISAEGAASRRSPTLGSWLSSLTSDLGCAVVLGEWAQSHEGQSVGGWRVGRAIGTGGFGTVYRATRPGRPDAAIKFPDSTPIEIRRFSRERQILADFDHPSICRFLDAGVTAHGTLYLVMEYVEGSAITNWCRQRRLNARGRLKLFVDLCRAVEYAHNHGVLHRDLKPSNILVDARGGVHVLDFGIAKLLDPARNGCQPPTCPGAGPGTLGFASPEQLRGEGSSFATDVYALGVILYLLLTGHMPVIANPGDPTPLAPSHLCADISANLDAVIFHALAFSALHRYQRVDRLREDIERHLSGRVVSILRWNLVEQVGLWVSTHRVSFLVSVGCSVLLLAGSSTGVQRQYEYERQQVAEQRAVRRAAYLAETGFPAVERALDHDAHARSRAVQDHTAYLQRLEALPERTLLSLDQNLAISAVACASEWRKLGDLNMALAVTAPVMPRLARRYELSGQNPAWRDLYAKALRQRIELAVALGRDHNEESRQLAQIERSPSR